MVKTVARWLEVAGGFLPLRFTLLFVLFFSPAGVLRFLQTVALPRVRLFLYFHDNQTTRHHNERVLFSKVALKLLALSLNAKSTVDFNKENILVGFFIGRRSVHEIPEIQRKRKRR